MRRPTQRAAFKGCPQHPEFNYYCHPCLVKTVGELCDILDKRDQEREHKEKLAARRKVKGD